MKKYLRKFWEEEEAMGTVEVVMILAALVCVALVFREALVDFVTNAVGTVFGDAQSGI